MNRTLRGAAQFNLGLMYERGLGVTQDYQQAIAWYQKGADQGQKEAKAKLDEVKAKLGALPAGDSSIASSSPTLEQAAAYILWSGEVDLSQMTTNADGSVNTPFHNLLGSPLMIVPAGITKVIDRANCVVEMVMEALSLCTTPRQLHSDLGTERSTSGMLERRRNTFNGRANIRRL